jgi:hypothetical protein
MSTKQEEPEIEYGKWHTTTAEDILGQERQLELSREEETIWPNWKNGVPTTFRTLVGSPRFYQSGVHYRYHTYPASLELIWNGPYLLSVLRQRNRLLPSTHQSEWSGVYRLFAQNAVIDRSCGKDPTGTLYLGLGGTGRKNWSIIRNRVRDSVYRAHHAFDRWHVCDLVRQKFPFDNLAVEWAFTGRISDYKGESVAEAIRAEAFLVNSYNGSFGEYPPWNQRG